MNRYNAVATREDEWWVVKVEGVGTTQGHSKNEAQYMAEDLVHAVTGQDPDEYVVTVRFEGEG